MDKQQLEKYFTYHAPTPSQTVRMETIRVWALVIATIVVEYTPAGPDQTAAIRKLREVVMTANAAIVLEEDEGELDNIQANAFTDFFKGLFGFLGFDKSTAAKIEIGVTAFVKTDIGQLAVDAVDYVEAKLAGASGAEKRDAAIAKLKEDATAAGKNLSAFAKSTVNWFIETALQSIVAKGLAAAATIAIHASAEDASGMSA